MSKDSPANKKKRFEPGAGCLALFGLPFAGVGCFMVYLVVTTVADAWSMSGWREVPCRITHAELKVHTDDDGSTYEALARYTYEFEGREYTADRVGVHSGADNIGSFQRDTHAQLERHWKENRPFRCFVNPDDPRQAVLFPEVRWGLLAFQGIFGLVFGAVGFGLVAGGLWAKSHARREKALAVEHPDEPWLRKLEWSTARITSGSKVRMMFSLGFALFWNAVSTPLAVLLIPEILAGDEPWIAAIVALFPVVGLGLAGWALYEILRWRKYGASTFEMAATPGVLGGSLAGVIRLSRPLDPPDGFRLTLNCIRKTTSRSGKSTTTHERIVWQDEQVIARGMPTSDGRGTAIPVLFAVPYDQPESTVEPSDKEIIWRLEAAADVPGVDYWASFDVPVFKTPDSREDFQLDSTPIEEYLAESDPDVELRRLGLHRTLPPVGYGTRLIFPMMRNPGMVFGVLMIALIWWGVVVVLFKVDAPIFFPIVFMLFGLGFVWGLLEVALYRSVIDIDEKGLTARGGWFGLGTTRRIEHAELEKIDVTSNMQSGKQVYCNLVARCRDGRKVTLGKRLPGRRQAQLVIDEIHRAIGEKPPRRETWAK